MATPARKYPARRPMAPWPPSKNFDLLENSDPNVIPFNQCIRKFKKLSDDAKANARNAGSPFGKPAKKPSPVSKKSASRTPRYAIRTRFGFSKDLSTPAYDAPRAPLWDFSDERHKIRAKLSSPYEAEQGQERHVNGDEESSGTKGVRSVDAEEAMAGLPEPGEGRVRFLVDTFERLLAVPGDCEVGNRGGNTRRKKEAMNSVSFPRAEEIDIAYSSVVSSSEVSFPVNGYNVDFANRDRISSAHGTLKQRRCNSIGSSERSWNRKVISATNPHPFKLRTEQRGKVKEENMIQRIRNILLEEEKLRIPLAQGLPWTTDVPENPMKPPAKEPTEPIDVVLHTNVRAVDRAEFDHQVAGRISFLEQIRLENKRQQKIEEEMGMKQLRKELVPRAQPMPNFARPFVPKRSVKPQTVPKEPRFHPRLMRFNSMF